MDLTFNHGRIHHEVEGEQEDEDETPSLLLMESLLEVPNELASLRETEHAFAGSSFIGVNATEDAGLQHADWPPLSSSSPTEPLNRDGDESGVSNGVSTALYCMLASKS